MSSIKLFQSNQIRSVWNEDEQQWYFSIVDVVGALSESANPNNYWKFLKSRLKKKVANWGTNCHQFAMKTTTKK